MADAPVEQIIYDEDVMNPRDEMDALNASTHGGSFDERAAIRYFKSSTHATCVVCHVPSH